MSSLDATSLRVWCQWHDMEVRVGLPAGEVRLTSQGIAQLCQDGACRRATEAEVQEYLDSAGDEVAVTVIKEAIGRPQQYTLGELADLIGCPDDA